MSDFSTGLCDCFADCSICIYTSCCLPCVLSDNWAQSRHEDCSICHFLAPAHPIWTRDNIRKMLGQREKQYVADCCAYLCCTPCATCQDARELKRLKNTPSSHSAHHHHHSNENDKNFGNNINQPLFTDVDHQQHLQQHAQPVVYTGVMAPIDPNVYPSQQPMYPPQNTYGMPSAYPQIQPVYQQPPPQ